MPYALPPTVRGSNAVLETVKVAAVVLTILVGASLLALGIVKGWKNRRGPHE